MILNVMGTLSQILKFIFEVQRKMTNEIFLIREIFFSIYKTRFFFGPLLFSNLITFLFFIHCKQFKVL